MNDFQKIEKELSIIIDYGRQELRNISRGP